MAEEVPDAAHVLPFYCCEMVKNTCFSVIPSRSVVVFVAADVKRSSGSGVFTDLSGLATRDYSPTVNTPIRLFMEGGTRRAAALTCLLNTLTVN